MTLLSAADLSKLAGIAMNPKFAKEHPIVSLRGLTGHAREAGKALLGMRASESGQKTAKVIRQWVSRQRGGRR